MGKALLEELSLVPVLLLGTRHLLAERRACLHLLDVNTLAVLQQRGDVNLLAARIDESDVVASHGDGATEQRAVDHLPRGPRGTHRYRCSHPACDHGRVERGANGDAGRDRAADGALVERFDTEPLLDSSAK